MVSNIVTFRPDKAYLIKAVGGIGAVEQISPANGTDFSAEEMHKYVGGYIELVRFPDSGRMIVVDEDGKRKQKPINEIATAMTRGVVADDDYIVGDVMLIGRNQIT